MSVDPAQIYIATPQSFDLKAYRDSLSAVLDAVPVACLRLSLASTDESELSRAADQLRDISHARDVAIVIDDHFRMVEKHGLDGVHLTSSSRLVREARKELGQDAIVGTYCGASRHAGMIAAEIGTDYISFGPVGDSGAIGDGNLASPDLFQWWSEMIEVPVVAEGNMDQAALESIAPFADFVTFGTEIWQADNPVKQLKHLTTLLG